MLFRSVRGGANDPAAVGSAVIRRQEETNFLRIIVNEQDVGDPVAIEIRDVAVVVTPDEGSIRRARTMKRAVAAVLHPDVLIEQQEQIGASVVVQVTGPLDSAVVGLRGDCHRAVERSDLGREKTRKDRKSVG